MKQSGRDEPGEEGAGVNVGVAERVGSAIGGGALVLYGLTRRSLGGALLAGLGGVLAYRGITGSCPVYRAAGISTAESDEPVGARLAAQGTTVERVVTINRTSRELYEFWRNLTNLPKFMSHLASVEMIDGERSRWVADGPAGSRIAWEAIITDDRPNELIAWQSLPDSDLQSSGRVEFTRTGDPSATEVRVTLRYLPPAGRMGAAVAKLLGSDPATLIAEEMRHFQQIMETGEIISAGRDSTTKTTGGESPSRFAWGARDRVDEASWESFPASDAPAW
jgi:uncharacterized membrane protein